MGRTSRCPQHSVPSSGGRRHLQDLNFTVAGDNLVSAAPHFFGSNPAEVKDGPKKGLRILGFEEDPARELVLLAHQPKQIVEAAARAVG